MIVESQPVGAVVVAGVARDGVNMIGLLHRILDQDPGAVRAVVVRSARVTSRAASIATRPLACASTGTQVIVRCRSARPVRVRLPDRSSDLSPIKMISRRAGSKAFGRKFL
jgi:hypothetical protein